MIIIIFWDHWMTFNVTCYSDKSSINFEIIHVINFEIKFKIIWKLKLCNNLMTTVCSWDDMKHDDERRRLRVFVFKNGCSGWDENIVVKPMDEDVTDATLDTKNLTYQTLGSSLFSPSVPSPRQTCPATSSCVPSPRVLQLHDDTCSRPGFAFLRVILRQCEHSGGSQTLPGDHRPLRIPFYCSCHSSPSSCVSSYCACQCPLHRCCWGYRFHCDRLRLPRYHQTWSPRSPPLCCCTPASTAQRKMRQAETNKKWNG